MNLAIDVVPLVNFLAADGGPPPRCTSTADFLFAEGLRDGQSLHRLSDDAPALEKTQWRREIDISHIFENGQLPGRSAIGFGS